MSVIAVVAAGLTRDATNGIRNIIGDASIGGVVESTLNAPVLGLRGVRGQQGSNASALYVPITTPDVSCPAFPSNGRNWVAWHEELVLESICATANNAVYSLIKAYMTSPSGARRELQLLMVLGASFLTVTGTAGPPANPTFTTTTMKDTRRDFSAAGVVAGDFLMTTTGVLVVTGFSNSGGAFSNDIINGTWHMVGTATKPTDQSNYNIYHAANVNYKWRITDGTTNWDSSSRACIVANTAPFVIDFQWQPSTTAGSNVMKLTVNGTLEINQTGGTTASASPTTLATMFWFGTDDVAKGNVWVEYVERYNCFYYDDVAQTDCDTYPIPYDADPNKRMLLCYRAPLRGGAHRYDQFTKSTGTDAAALLDARVVDLSTYVTDSVTGDKQSWQCVDLRLADIPIEHDDTIYALQSVGYSNVGGSGIILWGHSDGTANDDAGRNVRDNTHGFGASIWCNYKDPAGNAWTYDKANTCQTYVSSAPASALVYEAAQLILFKIGPRRAHPPMVVSQPVNVGALRI